MYLGVGTSMFASYEGKISVGERDMVVSLASHYSVQVVGVVSRNSRPAGTAGGSSSPMEG